MHADSIRFYLHLTDFTYVYSTDRLSDQGVYFRTQAKILATLTYRLFVHQVNGLLWPFFDRCALPALTPLDTLFIIVGMPSATSSKQDPKQLKRKYNVVPRWKPGQSGNPGGRVKGPSLTNRMILYTMQITDKKGPDGKPMTWLDRMALATLKLAEKGNSQALKEVWERLDGKVRQELDITIESQLWARLNAGRQRIQVEQQAVTDVAARLIPPSFGDEELESGVIENQPLTDLDNAIVDGHADVASVSDTPTDS